MVERETHSLCQESEVKSEPFASTLRCIPRPCRKVCTIIVAVVLIVGGGSAYVYQQYTRFKALMDLIQPPVSQKTPMFQPYYGPGVILKHIPIPQMNIQGPAEKFTDSIQHSAEEEKVISCYYNLPKLLNSTELMPHQMDTCVCTHINLAFARIKNKEIYLEDVQIEAIKQVVKWNRNSLKLLLSVGGAGENNGFSEMIADHASRKVFIRSLKKVLHDLKLHGVDLDWEFPVVHHTGLAKTNGSRERQHFSQLLREIRAEYYREKKGYLLTVAAAAQQIIVDAAYDINQLNEYTDYVNIMTYDFHFYSTVTPFTGLNSPLYGKGGDMSLLSTLNVNYTVDMYINKGLDKCKIVVGIPTYGHSFKLVNPENSMIGSPCSDYGTLGHTGFASYPEICNYIKNYTGQVTIVNDSDSKVPYLYRGYEWVSYDNRNSVSLKAAYIKDKGVRGAMIYSLNSDDYEGVCNNGNSSSKDLKFPLTRDINEHLRPMSLSKCDLT